MSICDQLVNFTTPCARMGTGKIIVNTAVTDVQVIIAT